MYVLYLKARGYAWHSSWRCPVESTTAALGYPNLVAPGNLPRGDKGLVPPTTPPYILFLLNGRLN